MSAQHPRTPAAGKRSNGARLRPTWRRVYLTLYRDGAEWQNFGEWRAESSRVARIDALRSAQAEAREGSVAFDKPGRVGAIDVHADTFAMLDEENFDESAVESSLVMPSDVRVRPPRDYRRLWFVVYKIGGRWQSDGEWHASDGSRGNEREAYETAMQEAEAHALQFWWVFYVVPVDVPLAVFR